MLQTKKVCKDTVAVSFSPTEILVRKSGKQYIGSEMGLVRLIGNKLYVDESVAREFGIEVSVVTEQMCIMELDDFNAEEETERLCAPAWDEVIWLGNRLVRGYSWKPQDLHERWPLLFDSNGLKKPRW